MDAKDLGERVLKCLSSRKKKCEALNKLVQTLRVQKKSLNQCLYKLQKQKKVIKLQISPPIWGLPEHFSLTKPKALNGLIYGTRGKKAMAKVSKNTKEKAEKVLQLLENKSAPLKAIEIARAIGLSRAGEVNSVLYSMEKEGLVSKVEGKPLTWKVNQETSGISPREVAMPAASLVSQSVAAGSFPVFQDSQLFGPDIELDCNDTEDMKDAIQEEADFDQDSSEEPGQAVSNINPSDSHHVTASEDPLIRNDLSEDFHMESSDSETINEITGKVIKGEIKSQATDLESLVYGRESNMNDVHPEQGDSLPLQNCLKRDVKSGPANTFNTNISFCKSESMGFSSLTVSSEGENVKLQSTPVIVNEVLDLEEDQEIRTKNLIGNRVSSTITTSEGDNTDMENCDKILKQLAVIPGMTQFVLVKKTQLSMEDFEEAIDKCQSLGYVSGCKKLWKITPEGIEYIEDKMDEDEKDKHQIEVINPKPQKGKPTGPPPSPMMILKKRGHLPENSERESQIVQQTRMFRDRSPLLSNVSRTAAPCVKRAAMTNSSENISKFPSSPTRPLSENAMEIISCGLKRTEISPPTTPSASLLYKEAPMSNSKPGSYQSIQRQVAENQPSLPSTTIVPPKPPHTFQTGFWSVTSASKKVTHSFSEDENTQNHSASSLPRNVIVQNEFRSLPVSVNKSCGPVSLNGLNSLALSNESFNILNKNPVSALMEYAQSRKTEARVEVLGRKGAAHRPTFTMAAFVGSRRFPPVTCNNKKDGRKEACDIALRQLIAEGQFQAESAKETSGTKPQASLDAMTHFDKIAALTHRGFTALVSQITADSFAGRKVIAGLVMKRSEDDTGILISLGTGNRCITGQQLSLQGNTVNDSHAEIITRRGFIRFLYKQLLEYDPSKHSPLFERSRTGKLQIRPKITFHLYISTAPCGDGALFSPRDAESSKTPVDTRIRPPHEPVFSSNVQGLLRTKVEGGEGTIPIEAGFKGQTFDGIQRGERLRTMSCTDKVCRWNVVGMQGALLSHFLEPVYLDSLTLGLLYDHGHLSRAVCCRVGRGASSIEGMLPTNYRLNHPWLGRVTVCDPPREVQKTKSLSVNWCFGDTTAEVTDGTTGLCNTSIEKGLFSRCSKRSFFNSFKAVCEKFDRQDLLQAETYKDVKMMATHFQQAREAMLVKFKENKYGPWVSKPVEEEMFGWEEQK